MSLLSVGSLPIGPASVAIADGEVQRNTLNVTTSFTDTVGHWAESSIIAASTQGYVKGYPDGKFNPNNQVTRAEFVKMAVVAMNIPVDSSAKSTNWYDPYITSATTSGMYKKNDFAATNWTQAMTRLEMARIAVRAIGESGKDDDEFMYIATAKGLISGTGNGKLDPNGTTTRAQTVVVIQRIQRVLKGETLPSDAQAVANAKKEMNTAKDPWGKAIRTTNLPKNYKEFPYILKDIPNEMYELERMPLVVEDPSYLQTPSKLFATRPQFNKSNIDIWMGHVDVYYSTLLNVDYKTISYEWSKKLLAETLHADNLPLKAMNEYVDWVKKNNIQIEGKLTPEPSMIYSATSGIYYVRSKFEFRIKNAKTLERVIYDRIYEPSYNKLKVGVWYEGYADVQIATNVGGNWGDSLKVYSTTSLFSKPATLRQK